MTSADVMVVMERSLMAMLTVGGPIVIAALVVGLAVSVFQAATQINEATLTFVPKLIVVAILLLAFGPAMLGALADLTRFVFAAAAAAGPVGG